MEMTGGEFLTKIFPYFRESPRSFSIGFTFPVLRRLFAGIEIYFIKNYFYFFSRAILLFHLSVIKLSAFAIGIRIMLLASRQHTD